MYLHITTRILTGGMPQLTHFKGVRPEHSRLQPSMFKNKPDIHTLSERCVCVTLRLLIPKRSVKESINKNWSLGKYDQSRKLWTFRMEATWKQWETGSNLKVYFLYKKKSNHPQGLAKSDPCCGHRQVSELFGQPSWHTAGKPRWESPRGGPPIQGKGEWFWGGTVVKGSQVLFVLWTAPNLANTSQGEIPS